MKRDREKREGRGSEQPARRPPQKRHRPAGAAQLIARDEGDPAAASTPPAGPRRRCGEVEGFADKQKLGEFRTSKPAVRQAFKEPLQAMGKLEPLCVAGGNGKRCSCCGKQVDGSSEEET